MKTIKAESIEIVINSRSQITFKADYKQIPFKLYWDLEISKGTCNQFFWLSLFLLDKSLCKELFGIILWHKIHTATLSDMHQSGQQYMDLASNRVWPLSTIHFPLQISASQLFKFSLLSSPPVTPALMSLNTVCVILPFT